MKITGTSKTGSTGKSKKAKGASSTGGTSFASMLESVEATTETTAPNAVAPVTPNSTFIPMEDDIPQEPKEHGAYLLTQLEELEKDILSGTPTQAVEKLKSALENSPLENANLTEKQRKILDALHLRASIEIAKLES